MKKEQKPRVVLAPEAWKPKVGDKWQHACHPNVYECEQKEDGIHVQRLVGSSLVGAVVVVPDLETLKLSNMGR